jgi:chromatin remodeling complex protein RSC6
MGKKVSPASKTSVDSNSVVVENNSTPVVVEEVVVEKPRKKRTKKVVAAEAVVPEAPLPPVEEVVVEEVVVEEEITPNDEVVEAEPVVAEKKKRRIVSKETFVHSAEELQKEILPLLEENNNKKLIKSFKVFLNDAFRLLRIKTHQKKQKDGSNSGFMRPVKPSSALEQFLAHIGEDTTQPLTRAHLTTVICKYIKEHDLQNPKDRRIIFPDEEIKRLFQITDHETEPLTYYNIQKRIQSHVSRIEDATTIATA